MNVERGGSRCLMRLLSQLKMPPLWLHKVIWGSRFNFEESFLGSRALGGGGLVPPPLPKSACFAWLAYYL